MKLFLFLPVLFVLFAGSVQAALVSEQNPYYGADYYNDLRTGASGDALVTRLKSILKSGHVRTSGGMDQIVSNCANQSDCYSHVAVGYNRARAFLMGGFYLVDSDGDYGVFDIYCQKVRPSSDFVAGSKPGPGLIPTDKVVNIEHTWAQSKFSHNYDKETQKSDMHHLFPTDSQMNADRGNYDFGEVVKDLKILKCPIARLGDSAAGHRIFEPPQVHKGNVARARFYFATRYDMHIEDEEEATLRKWNKEDPVDDEEMRRNNEIYKQQGDRNPFIDNPEIVDLISAF
jgi:deoxyribonuclease-1